MLRVYIFILISFLATIGLVLTQTRKNLMSFNENRKLKEFPKFKIDNIINGNYTKQIDIFIEDHFPGRDLIIRYVAQGKALFNLNQLQLHKKNEEKFIPIKKKIIKIESRNDAADSDSSNSIIDEILDDPSAEFKSVNGIFIYKNRGYQFFGGGRKSAARYANSINSFKEKFSMINEVYVMVIPSSTEFNLPKAKYETRASSEKINLQILYSNLNLGVHFANIYGDLQKHKNDYLYFKTDHHWTARGANIAYNRFAEIANFQPLDKNTMPIKIFNKKFVGSLYSWTKELSLLNSPDTIEFFDIPLINVNAKALNSLDKEKWSRVNVINKKHEYGSGYGIFLGMDFPFMEIAGSIKNNRKILVIKDSYANAFIPFLVNHFENIFVADIRYCPFNLKNIITEFKINEVLFLNNIVMANNPYFSKRLTKISK
jgi:hypothetical protein